jgi:hypothetical protein
MFGSGLSMVSLSDARKYLYQSTRGGTHTPGAREIYPEIHARN